MAEVQPSNVLTLRAPFPKEMSEIWRKYTDFFLSNKTCIGDITTIPTPSSPSGTFPELRPVSLPNEIVLHIIKYLNEPYKLQGLISYPVSPYTIWRAGPPAIIFYKPRSWASISSFQICSFTRAQAIKCYGRPLRHTLPFDANIDSLSLRADPSISHRNIYRGYITNMMTLFGYSFRQLTLFFHGKGNKSSASAAKPPKPLNNDLLHKIQCVEIEAENGPGLTNREWLFVGKCLSRWTSLNKLKLKAHQDDACDIPPNGEEEHVESFHLHKQSKRMIRGIMLHLNDLATLDVLEIEKTKARCQTQIGEENRGASRIE